MDLPLKGNEGAPPTYSPLGELRGCPCDRGGKQVLTDPTGCLVSQG
ncbi:unnamed protein product [Staurois parvus]|uniref:Uncharacterized protein n=1 Tax=Staurois parvus TaxID=386267 RepID=A0ABN9E3J1_9NEOB|nr:unnamed protein product [Staurois parvus]